MIYECDSCDKASFGDKVPDYWQLVTTEFADCDRAACRETSVYCSGKCKAKMMVGWALEFHPEFFEVQNQDRYYPWVKDPNWGEKGCTCGGKAHSDCPTNDE